MVPSFPPPKMKAPPPTPFQRMVRGKQAWSCAVVLLIAGWVALYILSMRELLRPPPTIIIGSALLLDVAATIFLLRVDWEYYWATLPYRLRAVGRVFGIVSGVGLLTAAASTLGFWYGSMLWTTHNEFWALPVLVVSGVGALYAVFGSAGGLAACVWGLLVNNPKEKVSGRYKVEGQDIHGAADFASESSVDAALRGSSAASAPAFKFED